MVSGYWFALAIIFGGMFYSIRSGKLTIAAACAGGVIGLMIFLGGGFTGLAMIATFFMLGTAATSWKLNIKQQLGLAEANKGKRTAGQVIANAGSAALVGLLAWAYPQKAGVFDVMMAAGFASATADTLSSELGNIYGRRFYNIFTFKNDARGFDGVISLEGTVIGIAGSVIIALIYSAGFEWSVHFLWIVVAGTIGNLSDSFLGATLERSNYLDNNAVNFLNTFIASVTAYLLVLLSHI